MLTMTRIILFFSTLGLVFLTTITKAQVQLMPAVNVLVANANALGVGSISGRYFASSHIAAGINIKYIPTTKIVLTTVEVDYFFNSAKSIRPFVGLEAGIFTENRKHSVYTTWGIAPKLGVQGRLSSLLNVQLEISRPIAVRKGERFEADNGFLIGAGLNFSLGADK